MEYDLPLSESKSLDPDLFTDLKDLVDTLIDEYSEPLLGLEDEDNEHAFTGERRELQGTNGRVVVARYSDEERAFITEELRNEGYEINQPYGHIEMEYSGHGAAIDCALYLTDDKKVTGVATCKLSDEEEVLLEDSQACYEFAANLGLQDIWVTHMFSARSHTQVEVDLTSRQVRDLTEALQGTT